MGERDTLAQARTGHAQRHLSRGDVNEEALPPAAELNLAGGLEPREPFRISRGAAGWAAPRRTAPGGQARYSNLTIVLVLPLRLVLHLALRQAEGFARSVLRVLGHALPVPDHTTLSRRSRAFAAHQPQITPHGPVHLVVDSTGLQLFGRGEGDTQRHGRPGGSRPNQHGEKALAVEVLNRMVRTGKPVSVRVA